MSEFAVTGRSNYRLLSTLYILGDAPPQSGHTFEILSPLTVQACKR